MKRYLVIDDEWLTPDELEVVFEGVSYIEAESDEDADKKIKARREYIKEEAARRISAKAESGRSRLVSREIVRIK